MIHYSTYSMDCLRYLMRAEIKKKWKNKLKHTRIQNSSEIIKTKAKNPPLFADCSVFRVNGDCYQDVFISYNCCGLWNGRYFITFSWQMRKKKHGPNDWQLSILRALELGYYCRGYSIAQRNLATLRPHESWNRWTNLSNWLQWLIVFS